ncbi:MAG: carboxypeptidase regulatory-like domain-containing protein [Chloroflexi bacterium]|nr:carboxypeptidase regulatory-like domain-containing protein [Chloroflexota bacterium]
MIDQLDLRLKDWVSTITGGILPSLAPPSDAPAQIEAGVSLYLFELSTAPVPPTPNGTRRLPLMIMLNYLVTTWAKEPEEAHRLLGQLAFAAMEIPDFEVKLDPIPLTAWTAFAVRPRPAFILRVPLRLERPEPPVRLVRKPIKVEVTPLESVSGIVLTPDNVPVVSAYVTLPALNLSERTDGNGRFHFPAVPVEPRVRRLNIRAKGQEQSVTITGSESDHGPFVIRFNIQEG